jgi:hypothetical protein
MNLSISSAAAAASTTRIGQAAVPQPMKESVKALGKALQGGDLTAARGAYVNLLKQAPGGATMTPGSPLANLGKALAQGDIDAAKAAFASLLRNPVGPAQSPPIRPELSMSLAPTVSSNGGSAGSLLDAVA